MTSVKLPWEHNKHKTKKYVKRTEVGQLRRDIASEHAIVWENPLYIRIAQGSVFPTMLLSSAVSNFFWRKSCFFSLFLWYLLRQKSSLKESHMDGELNLFRVWWAHQLEARHTCSHAPRHYTYLAVTVTSCRLNVFWWVKPCGKYSNVVNAWLTEGKKEFDIRKQEWILFSFKKRSTQFWLFLRKIWQVKDKK